MNRRPTALITGITGQDGSFLAEQLLEEGWNVVGLVRRSASRNLWRLQGILGRIRLVDGDLLDFGSLFEAIQTHQPDHVYNLAAQSFVATSWKQPLLTGEVTALGAARLLEAVRLAKSGGMMSSMRAGGWRCGRTHALVGEHASADGNRLAGRHKSEPSRQIDCRRRSMMTCRMPPSFWIHSECCAQIIFFFLVGQCSS